MVRSREWRVRCAAEHRYGLATPVSHALRVRRKPHKLRRAVDVRLVRLGLHPYSIRKASMGSTLTGSLRAERYSAFNTVTGSTAVALRAGARHATADTSSSPAATTSNVAGSLGSTS